jgi:hypothetical protein
MGRVDPSQCKNKSGYCHNFKTQFGGQSRARSGSRVRLTIDLGQHKDKNYYYHSFEIQLSSRPEIKPKSHEKRVTQIDPIQHKISIVVIIILKLNLRVN